VVRKIRAERKLGQMLKMMDRAKPEDTLLRGNIMQPRENQTLDDLGISKIQSFRWQLEEHKDVKLPAPLESEVYEGDSNL
jgi:hypothetical protein